MKFNMADTTILNLLFLFMAAAILNYNFVMLDHQRNPFVHLKFPLQISF